MRISESVAFSHRGQGGRVMPLEIMRNDIKKVYVDAIVNAANSFLL